MNKREVRFAEFAMHREWAERFDTDTLRKMLAAGNLGSGKKTAAREVLRSRGETSGSQTT